MASYDEPTPLRPVACRHFTTPHRPGTYRQVPTGHQPAGGGHHQPPGGATRSRNRPAPPTPRRCPTRRTRPLRSGGERQAHAPPTCRLPPLPAGPRPGVFCQVPTGHQPGGGGHDQPPGAETRSRYRPAPPRPGRHPTRQPRPLRSSGKLQAHAPPTCRLPPLPHAADPATAATTTTHPGPRPAAARGPHRRDPQQEPARTADTQTTSDPAAPPTQKWRQTTSPRPSDLPSAATSPHAADPATAAATTSHQGPRPAAARGPHRRHPDDIRPGSPAHSEVAANDRPTTLRPVVCRHFPHAADAATATTTSHPGPRPAAGAGPHRRDPYDVRPGSPAHSEVAANDRPTTLRPVVCRHFPHAADPATSATHHHPPGAETPGQKLGPPHQHALDGRPRRRPPSRGGRRPAHRPPAHRPRQPAESAPPATSDRGRGWPGRRGAGRCRAASSRGGRRARHRGRTTAPRSTPARAPCGRPRRGARRRRARPAS